MQALEVVDHALHFLMLLAISPVVLTLLCWLRYGAPALLSPTTAHPHPEYGEVFGGA